jgi:hypothetical protein
MEDRRRQPLRRDLNVRSLRGGVGYGGGVGGDHPADVAGSKGRGGRGRRSSAWRRRLSLD